MVYPSAGEEKFEWRNEAKWREIRIFIEGKSCTGYTTSLHEVYVCSLHVKEVMYRHTTSPLRDKLKWALNVIIDCHRVQQTAICTEVMYPLHNSSQNSWIGYMTLTQTCRLGSRFSKVVYSIHYFTTLLLTILLEPPYFW